MSTFTLDPRTVPDGGVLVVGIRYELSTSGRVYTFAMLKIDGLWYVTGSGKSPTAAGWLAVERWLRDGREVVRVQYCGDPSTWTTLFPRPERSRAGSPHETEDQLEPTYYDSSGETL
jgi:hypothetical protein